MKSIEPTTKHKISLCLGRYFLQSPYWVSPDIFPIQFFYVLIQLFRRTSILNLSLRTEARLSDFSQSYQGRELGQAHAQAL